MIRSTEPSARRWSQCRPAAVRPGPQTVFIDGAFAQFEHFLGLVKEEQIQIGSCATMPPRGSLGRNRDQGRTAGDTVLLYDLVGG
jgi:hypothetical protein